MHNTELSVIVGVGVGIASLYAFGGIAAVFIGAALADLTISAVQSRRPVRLETAPPKRDPSGK